MAGKVAAGASEHEIAAAGEAAARSLGCTGFGYRTIVGSGPRSAGVVPTPTGKVLADGEVVMFSISPRCGGYASSAGDTTVVGGAGTDAQRRVLSDMAQAFNIARAQLVPGRSGKQMDAPVREFLLGRGYAPYMLVPFIHTVGLYEAEAPFFGPRSDALLRPNMTVCVDISLFGMPDVPGARYETGFVIDEEGARPLAPDVDDLILAHA